MGYYIVIYRVTVDRNDRYYHKEALTARTAKSGWQKLKTKIDHQYNITYPKAKTIEIDILIIEKVALNDYLELVGRSSDPT